MHEQGLPVTAKTFTCVIDEYVRAREKSCKQGKTTPAMLRQVRRVVKFWKEYAGSKPIHSICDADLRNYVEWRRDYYAKSLQPIPCNAKLNPADKTLQWEIMLGKAIIKWAHEKGLRGGILYLGADYLVNPWILVGALVQFDWMDDESKKLNTDVSGDGWMAGPYVSLRLSEHILFDARGAWGRSNNEVSPLGTYKDSFDTDRWLAKANVTGNWFVERLRISPSVGVIYVEETQDSYVDSLGSTVVSQSVHIGRLMFGPEFGYPI